MSEQSAVNSPEKRLSPIVKNQPQPKEIYNYDANINNRNQNETKVDDTTLMINNIAGHNENNNKSPEIRTKNLINIYDVDTSDLILLDNVTNNIIKLEDFKKVDVFSMIDNNFNTSTNSLNSENLSSPMQTSTDVYLDSEVLSTTDIASNDSQSPKNLQTDLIKQASFSKENIQKFNKLFNEQDDFGSNNSLSNPKSDQSLLNSNDDSCDSSSPLRNVTRDYKKQKKHKKKHFGVKTLQSIFNRIDGYSDISTTASEMGEDSGSPQEVKQPPQKREESKLETDPSKREESNLESVIYKSPPSQYPEPKAQFDQNIHNLLSEIFLKSLPASSEQPPQSKAVGSKKYFSLHGQNLRVGKALRLCPNEEYANVLDSEQKKEKLLARYVYKANNINADGVGDPDFGTPV